MISATSEHITLIDVMKEIHGDVFETSALDEADKKSEEQVLDLERMVQNFEKNILRHACEQYGSTRKIAKAVGISQTQLVRKKKKYGL
jgi:TyrR family helix-turn-helix protein